MEDGIAEGSGDGPDNIKYDNGENPGLALYKGTTEVSGQTSKVQFKTVNNTSLIGSGNIDITQASPFPTGTGGFIVDNNHTTYDFANSVLNYSGYAPGKSWYGALNTNDLPTGLGNVECSVKAMTNSIAVIELYSANRAPYHWEYNTASYSGHDDHKGWKLVPTIREARVPKTVGTYDLKLTVENEPGAETSNIFYISANTKSLPVPPTANGDYKLHVENGVLTWVAL